MVPPIMASSLGPEAASGFATLSRLRDDVHICSCSFLVCSIMFYMLWAFSQFCIARQDAYIKVRQ